MYIPSLNNEDKELYKNIKPDAAYIVQALKKQAQKCHDFDVAGMKAYEHAKAVLFPKYEGTFFSQNGKRILKALGDGWSLDQRYGHLRYGEILVSLPTHIGGPAPLRAEAFSECNTPWTIGAPERITKHEETLQSLVAIADNLVKAYQYTCAMYDNAKDTTIQYEPWSILFTLLNRH